MRQRELTAEIEAIAERSYDQLEGQWHQWLEVAKRYEGKVARQDKLDVRHNIMLELYRATQRDGKPLPILRAYRIASLIVALYWREQNKASVKVCVFNGYPTELRCKACKNKTEGRRCAWLGIRPIESLDSQVSDCEGYRVRLMDTVATDKAVDLPDVWLDLKTWLLGCPTRLIQIAYQRLEGKPLSDKDRKYLSRYRQREQLKLF